MPSSIPQVDGNMSLETQDNVGNVALVITSSSENGSDAESTNLVTDEISQDLVRKRPAHFDGVTHGQLCGFCDQKYTVIDEFIKQLN